VAVLVLDSEAVSALARPRVDPARHERVRAAMRSAHSRNAPIRIPAVVLVELYRGRGIDEAIDNVLARGFAQVVTTGARMARVAGHLLAGIGGGSDMAIDALVVATAIRFGGGVVATHDPHDLQRLAVGHSNVVVFEI
jgi:predicted nucleic acid-binding protein